MPTPIKRRLVRAAVACGTLAAFACSAQPLPGATPVPAPAPAPAPTPLIKPLPGRLLQPVAPGTLQPAVAPELRQPLAPQVWTFAAIRAEATGPTAIRVSWLARADATHYRIVRDDTVLAELPADGAGAMAHLDTKLAPNQTVRYRVDAIARRAGTATKPGVRLPGLASATPLALSVERLLESSQTRGAATPVLEAPRDFRARVADARQRTVRLSWALPRWATGVQVLRNGAPIATLDGAMQFDDLGAPAGTLRYAVRSLHAAVPNQAPVAGGTTSELSLRLGPMRIVAFGDSIMAGQGLAEGAKFSALTRDLLARTLGVEVELTSLAHSGAIVRRDPAAPLPPIGRPESTDIDQNRLVTPSEVPNSLPTVLHQVNVQAASRAAALQAGEVDLVLIDGCINDVDVTTILNPMATAAQVAAAARARCSTLAPVLLRVHEIFPRAAIVVTGYYPIVSDRSDMGAVAGLVASAVGTAALAAPLVGLPPDPIGAIAATLVAAQAFKPAMLANSAAFASAADTTLATVVQSVNTQLRRPGLAVYAPLPYRPENAYGAPDTWLWLVPALAPAALQDDVLAPRKASCDAPGVVATSEGAPFTAPSSEALALSRAKCHNAAMGHPNRRGALAYAAAIALALQPQLAAWRQLYAPVQP